MRIEAQNAAVSIKTDGSGLAATDAVALTVG
jgi:hypothetical protein